MESNMEKNTASSLLDTLRNNVINATVLLELQNNPDKEITSPLSKAVNALGQLEKALSKAAGENTTQLFDETYIRKLWSNNSNATAPLQREKKAPLWATAQLPDGRLIYTRPASSWDSSETQDSMITYQLKDNFKWLGFAATISFDKFSELCRKYKAIQANTGQH